MVRTILGAIAGLLAWAVVVTAIDIGLRHAMTGYAAAEPLMAYTLPMMIARLAMAVVTSLIAGAVVGWVAPASRIAPWITGLVMLALFLPVHIRIWPHFPVWYHLFFLLTLAPLVALGARLRLRRPAAG